MPFSLRSQTQDWLKPYLLTSAILCIIVFFAVLVIHAYMGTFTRYWADDYSLANVLQSEGLVGAQQWWYLNWTGAFSSSLAISLMALIGPRVVSVLPLLALGLWLICMTWTIMQFTQKVHLPKPLLVSILLAVLLIAIILNTIPNVFESIYWQTGMLFYLFPLIILTVYVGLIAYSMRRKPNKSVLISLVVLSTVLTFIAGGCNQGYTALQTGALFLIMGFGVLRSSSDFKRSALPLVVAGFLGSLIAMVISIIAPGNAFREAFYPPHPGLFSLVKSSITTAFHDMGYYNFHQVTNIAIALVLPAVLAFTMHPTEPNPPNQPNPNSKRALIFSLLLSPIVGFILIVFCFAPSIWGESGPPPNRAIIFPQFVLVCTAIYWAYHAGLAARHLHLPSKKW